MPKHSAKVKKLRFDWEFFQQYKKFEKVSGKKRAFLEEKLDFFAVKGYAAFRLRNNIGLTKVDPKKWKKCPNKKPPNLSQEIWDKGLWRFWVNKKIRIIAIFDESPQDEVIGYVLWVDLTHRTGDK